MEEQHPAEHTNGEDLESRLTAWAEALTAIEQRMGELAAVLDWVRGQLETVATTQASAPPVSAASTTSLGAEAAAGSGKILGWRRR